MIMIRISNIKIAAYKEQHKVLEQEICRLLHIKSLQNLQYHIVKKSVDARKKDSIQCIYTVDVSGLKDEAKIVARCKKDTACLSYVEKNNSNMNVEFAKIKEPSEQIQVYCDASNCVFEHDSKCRADKIEIKNVENSDRKYCEFESKYPDGHWKNSVTMCKTFESKE